DRGPTRPGLHRGRPRRVDAPPDPRMAAGPKRARARERRAGPHRDGDRAGAQDEGARQRLRAGRRAGWMREHNAGYVPTRPGKTADAPGSHVHVDSRRPTYAGLLQERVIAGQTVYAWPDLASLAAPRRSGPALKLRRSAEAAPRHRARPSRPRAQAGPAPGEYPAGARAVGRAVEARPELLRRLTFIVLALLPLLAGCDVRADPRITRLSTYTPSVGGELVVYGVNFPEAVQNAVSIGGMVLPEANVRTVDSRRIEVTVPAGTPNGLVTVRTPDGDLDTFDRPVQVVAGVEIDPLTASPGTRLFPITARARDADGDLVPGA